MCHSYPRIRLSDIHHTKEVSVLAHRLATKVQEFINTGRTSVRKARTFVLLRKCRQRYTSSFCDFVARQTASSRSFTSSLQLINGWLTLRSLAKVCLTSTISPLRWKDLIVAFMMSQTAWTLVLVRETRSPTASLSDSSTFDKTSNVSANIAASFAKLMIPKRYSAAQDFRYPAQCMFITRVD